MRKRSIKRHKGIDNGKSIDRKIDRYEDGYIYIYIYTYKGERGRENGVRPYEMSVPHTIKRQSRKKNCRL